MKEKESERRSKHKPIQERRHLPFSNSIRAQREKEREREREKRLMKTHTIYTKLYQTERRRKKKWIFRVKKNLLELMTEEEKKIA